MSRYFMVQSWVGSHENEPDYNGNQCGERNVRSSEVAPLYDQYGNANIKAFSDEALLAKKKAQTKTKSVLDSILLADRNYERLCNLSQQLDDELDSGQITDFEAYCAARKNIDKRLEKAWERCCKERPELLEPDQYPSKGSELALDFEPKIQRQYDYSIIPSGSVFAELDDGNVFKKIYTNLLTAMNNLSRLWNVSKTIIHEGVI